MSDSEQTPQQHIDFDPAFLLVNRSPETIQNIAIDTEHNPFQSDVIDQPPTVDFDSEPFEITVPGSSAINKEENASPESRTTLTVPSKEPTLESVPQTQNTAASPEDRINADTPQKEKPILTGSVAAADQALTAGIGSWIIGIYDLASSIYLMGIPEDDPRALEVRKVQEEFEEFDEALFYKSLEEDEEVATVFGAIGAIGPDVFSPGSKAKKGGAAVAVTLMATAKGAKYLNIQRKLLKLLSASRKRIVEVLKTRPKDFVYGKGKWWGSQIQSYGLMKESMKWLGKQQHHLIPKSLLKYGPQKSKGLIDYIPTVSLEGSEHLAHLHPELNSYLAEKMGKHIDELWEMPELTPKEVEQAIQHTKDFYISKDLPHFAEAIDEFVQNAYNIVK